jgi:hypothetical protein
MRTKIVKDRRRIVLLELLKLRELARVSGMYDTREAINAALHKAVEETR